MKIPVFEINLICDKNYIAFIFIFFTINLLMVFFKKIKFVGEAYFENLTLSFV